MSDNEDDEMMFSNPLQPPEEVYMQEEEEEELVSAEHQPLTNADFRKLLMTPRVSAQPKGSIPAETDDKKILDSASKRKEKKILYAKLNKQEEEKQKELAAKYRDRAKERREGSNNDYDESKMLSTTADYRAVAPDAKSGATLAERRKQLIQESKYLGGDMEHTHLVKGLDYALLEKVRAEISFKELEDEQGMETIIEKKEKEEEVVVEKVEFKTRIGRNIFRVLFRNQVPEKNELFMPGRMAYAIDLEDEYLDTDVPLTIIRSKADCVNVEATTTLSTNDIVINKLTQILSYLRQGRRDKRKKLKEKGKLKEEEKNKVQDEGIYGDMLELDLGKPRKEVAKEKDRKERDKGRSDHRDRHDRERHRDRRDDRDRDRGGDRKRSYFEKPAEEEDDMRGNRGPQQSTAEMVRSINEKFGGHAPPRGGNNWGPPGPRVKEEQDSYRRGGRKGGEGEDGRLARLKKKVEVDSYAECYPGFAEADDAIIESDDEADYTKMDPGNKKGPVSRWDFDTQEEYSDYMSNKEALPKAAFQYGVKMADGRRTRRGGPKDEKKELDREWQKIQNIIKKRKDMGQPDGPPEKSARH